jgi:putative aldouronate transport system substrate-binding protein
MVSMLSGCGGSSKTSDPTGSADTTANTTASGSAASASPDVPGSDIDTSSPYGKYKEPIELSVFSLDFKNPTTEYDSSNPERKSASENMWINAYSDYLNIKVNRIIAEDGTALNATINTSMASGSLPDVMVVPKTMFYVLAENDVCADLKESYKTYIESYGKLLAKCVATSPDALTKGTVGGKLLGFPTVTASFNATEVLWIRQDWLDKVGKKLPTTIDEMIDIARAFKKAKLGGDKTIGLGMNFTTESGKEAVSFSSILAPYGVVMNTWQKDGAGKYAFTNTMDAMKDGLLKLQEIYRDGIIKSDFAVTNTLKEEVANGLVGMYYGSSTEGVVKVKANLLNDPNAKWTCCRIPTQNGEAVRQWTNSSITEFIVVNKKYKHPEAIFKMLELEMHMCKEASAEETAKYYMCKDGYPAWYLRVFKNFDQADNPLVLGKLIIEGLAKNAKEISPVANSAYQNVLGGLAGDRAKEGYILVYTVARPILLDMLEKDKNCLVASYDGPITENISLYQSTINEALTNAMLEVIMGADISVFEKAVKTWYATGGQTITDDVNNYYKSME